MKLMIVFVSFVFLASCASLSWVVVSSEKKISPRVYEVRLDGNAFSRGEDMINKLNSRAEELCGKDNYEHSFNQKEQEQMYATGGAFYMMSKPVLDATITCKS